MRCRAPTRTGATMAKRKTRSKVQKRKGGTARPKASKVSKSAQEKATKRTIAKPKPKRAPAKKAARKEVWRVKQPVAPAVETVAVEVIEQPAPGVITVTEVEETRQAS